MRIHLNFIMFILITFTGLSAAAEVADTVFMNGNVYTVDKDNSKAEAVAVKDGIIIFVGSNDDVNAFIGETTHVIDMPEQDLLPGFVDTQMYATSAASNPDNKGDDCYWGPDLKANLQQIAVDDMPLKIQACGKEKNRADGEWIEILSVDNRLLADVEGYGPASDFVSKKYATLREMLDATSTTQPIVLYASGYVVVNSLALQRTRLQKGMSYVPVTKESLQGYWKDHGYADDFGVDDNGEPDGTVKGLSAGYIFDYPEYTPEQLEPMKNRLNELVADSGVTTVQMVDATKAEYSLFEDMEKDNNLNFRVVLNPFIDTSKLQQDSSDAALDSAVEAINKVRDRFSGNQYIKLNGVNVSIDGALGYPVQEAAMFEPYLQPVFSTSTAALQKYAIDFYIDLDGVLCKEVQRNIASYDADKSNAFKQQHKFTPQRCIKNYGKLMVEPNTLNRLATRLDKQDYAIQFGATGPRAVRVALDAIEKTRKQSSSLPHSLVWSEFIDPSDRARFAKLDAYLSITGTSLWPAWSWDSLTIEYYNELETVNNMRKLYSNRDSDFIKEIYPYRTLAEQGAPLSWASGAYANDPFPSPFAHLLKAMDREEWIPTKDPAEHWADSDRNQWGMAIFNKQETLPFEDLLRIFTINSAKTLRMDDEIGSIEVGKRADLIVVDEQLAKLTTGYGRTPPRFALIKPIITMMDGRFTKYNECVVYGGDIKAVEGGCGFAKYVKFIPYGVLGLIVLMIVRRIVRARKEKAAAAYNP